LPAGPTNRRIVGRYLAKYREENSQMNQTQAARQVDLSRATVSKMEDGLQQQQPNNVRALLDLFGAPRDVREKIAAIARETRDQGPYVTEFADSIPDWFRIYAGLEPDAEGIEEFNLYQIPGLLQTPEYLRALMLAHRPTVSEDALAQSVKLRKARQATIKAGVLNVILTQGAIEQEVGGPAVMADQLQLISKLAREGYAQVRIIPREVGAHPGMNGSFTILRFAESIIDLVYMEDDHSAKVLDGESDLERYSWIFTTLRGDKISLNPQESIAMLDKVAADALARTGR
jgi:hypothetical protein